MNTKDRLLTDREIDKAMEYADDLAQDYTIRDGKPAPIPERQVAIAQDIKTTERILKLLPVIPTRFDHNKTCFNCVNRIRKQV
jgi:hypothetical protein